MRSKDQLITEIRLVFDAGWHRSVRSTRDTRNDGAVGNTLEALLGIEENNLPIPNASEWELKGQRQGSASLITLKHVEPSPKAARIVPSILLPRYGWPHAEAGAKYPSSEMSFRSTTSAVAPTNRGFQIIVDRHERKLRFVFDARKADASDATIRAWLETVNDRAGLGPIEPQPYWGFDDLEPLMGTKLRNCFYVTAESEVRSGHEFFRYTHLYLLSGFSFQRLLKAMADGHLLIDFDARSGHNHGTKFRLKQGHWPALYTVMRQVI
jgi:hypothetical protein